MNLFKPKFWDKDKISFFSILLFPISLLIQFLTFIKPYLVKNQKCSIPVICVGNIYLGGTGKTPLCIEIFSILKKINKNPAFVRKKYDSYQDEFYLQEKIGPIFHNKKRIKAIEEAAKNKIDIVILDDGFQDFSIKKNLSIICFNEKQWIGNGMLIPSGPLRENLSALNRADCVFINGRKNTIIENKILSKNKKIKIFYTNYKTENINKFKNKKVIAFAGIANPSNFFDLLKDNKINVLKEIKFTDHHNYLNVELESLINKTKEANTILLTTEKDYLRIDENYRNNINYLKISLEIEKKEEFIYEMKKVI